MLELENSRRKQRTDNGSRLLGWARDTPSRDSMSPFTEKSSDNLESHKGPSIWGERGWKPPAFHDAVECMGLGPIFDAGSPWPRRAFWILVVFLGLVLAAYQLVQQIQVYFSWPVNSMVDIRSSSSLPFPRVSICNLNRLRSDALPVGSNPNATSLIAIFPADMLNDQSVDWREIYTDFAHGRHETLLSCTFKAEPCGAENISTIYSDQGACLAYNADGLVSAQHRGSLFGLTLELNTELEYYVGMTGSIGFQVHVSNSKVPLGEGYSIQPGQLTYLDLHRTQISYLPPPWEDCGTISLRDTPVYSAVACRLECETNFIIDACGCQLPSMQRSAVAVCEPRAETDCALPARRDFMEQGWPCNMSCPHDCFVDLYDVTMYHTKFSDSYIQQMVDRYGKDHSYWRKNFVKIIVYYQDLTEQVVIHQKVYDVFALLCDLGGAIGLVLGASVITVLECFDFCLWRTVTKVRKRSDGNEKTVSSSKV